MEPVKYMGPDIFHEQITRKITILNECRAKGEPLDMCMDAVADKYIWFRFGGMW